MIISFTGAQNTGKTTLLNLCRNDRSFENFDFVLEVTRQVKRKHNLNINESGDNITQLCIIHQHLQNYLEAKYSTVMDRCILDGVVYTQWLYDQGSVDGWVLDYAENVFEELITKIDHIFYTYPDADITMEDDGVRSVNETFREDIIEIFEKRLERLEGKVSYTILSGTVNERMEKIRKTLINF